MKSRAVTCKLSSNSTKVNAGVRKKKKKRKKNFPRNILQKADRRVLNLALFHLIFYNAIKNLVHNKLPKRTL